MAQPASFIKKTTQYQPVLGRNFGRTATKEVYMGGHHRNDSVRKRRNRGPQLITGQTRISGTRQPIYVVEILGETEAQNKNRDVKNQEKRVEWENKCQKN